MNIASELIKGTEAGVDSDRWMLHMRKRGMKSVREMERTRRRLADQIVMKGKAQRYLPRKSPRLNTRKCVALNRSG
jgi:hypothetical protein